MCHMYEKDLLLKSVYKFWMNYLSPANFNYFWNMGSMAFMCLIMQMLTGLFLAMHYKSDMNLAFSSIEYLNSEVYYGWFMRYFHSNGSSMFFFLVYLHMLRGVIFGSFFYPSQLVWGSGIIIFILMVATAFLGYVLPWGQMSFWACTVMISLFSAMPVMGNDLVYWMWGGYAVDDATLNSFFSLHFFFPFLILGVTIMHLIFLHEFGSNNPMGVFSKYDGFSMLPNYMVKDFHSLNIVFMFMIMLVFFFPDVLGHPDNYILSNSMVTPTHMVPEWYFLAFYAILSSVPDKLMGLILFVVALVALLMFPLLVGSFGLMSSMYFKPFVKLIMLVFIFNCMLLGWLGGQPVMAPFYFMGQMATFMYFFMILLFSFCNYLEQSLLYLFLKLNISW